jgi:hypothetical protein
MNTMHYNAECISCGCVQSVYGGSLWWKAKKNAERGYLDAIGISGVECGCERPLTEPNAPYRVFGWTDDGHTFNRPHFTFVGAVRDYIDNNSYGAMANIIGVSQAVKERLRSL